ncbi:peptidoglycan/xylan/chitin deacetylase (PgdA/CDA1 family) [Paenibacillus taihuensis]|uniref:Peptidoglycan/xylan/chitin deacetylase (PgdA/CDA1 family) n=1 Tax=Paenibacillus taihuensis TaxID=1156355 RepID=A0A3D9RNE9_9BACL|nr:polysaccharide deacetylase family protein [Paenibacillus taihuensis]REE80998.1 peptidoglycan/xylan/chitin deacetylase (PgdA/CDA1 family) [Paenibacillus taihuensis]
MASTAATIYNEVKTEEKLLAFTFDDGPNPEWTPQFLDAFKKVGGKATFYVLGTNMESYPDIARRIVEEGHELGNHSYLHPHLPELDRDAQREELQRAEQLITAVTGRRVNTFRPPYLDVNDELLEVAGEFGYAVIHGVNLASNDWDTPGVEHILATTREAMRSGSILLFHDGFGDRSQSLEAVTILLEEAVSQGYRIVTVSELLGLD